MIIRSDPTPASEKSLTDFEIEGLYAPLSLADGHAYQDMPFAFRHVVRELEVLWVKAETVSVPLAEDRLRNASARLSSSAAMSEVACFKICPTASNATDVVAAVLADKSAATRMIEPTFDNLALIMKRRRVQLAALPEDQLMVAAEEGSLDVLLGDKSHAALFLVQPNNPTGRQLNERAFRIIANLCAERGTILVLDNTFRLYNRSLFDDYAILDETGVSFMAIEDTGKVWPTQDLKASILSCSSDLARLVCEIYNEMYLCHSRFALTLLERYVTITADLGLEATIWRHVDRHRALLRQALAGTALVIDPRSVDSEISVEWLDCRQTGMNDLQLTAFYAERGLGILPGRHFFWASGSQRCHQYNVRLALMKPRRMFEASLSLIRRSADIDVSSVAGGGRVRCSV